MDRLVILALALAIAGALSGGLYTVSGGNGTGFVTNRFTGTTWYCATSSCFRVDWREKISN